MEQRKYPGRPGAAEATQGALGVPRLVQTLMITMPLMPPFSLETLVRQCLPRFGARSALDTFTLITLVSNCSICTVG